MLRRGHRFQAERLAPGGPRRPSGRRAPSGAPRAGSRPATRRRRTDSCTPTKRPGERLLTPAGTFSTSAGRALRSALLDGCAAERPSGRPKPRTEHAAVGEAPREGREGQGPASQRSGRAHIQRVDGIGLATRNAQELGGESRARLARGVEDHVLLGARGRAGHTSVVQTFEPTRVAVQAAPRWDSGPDLFKNEYWSLAAVLGGGASS